MNIFAQAVSTMTLMLTLASSTALAQSNEISVELNQIVNRSTVIDKKDLFEVQQINVTANYGHFIPNGLVESCGLRISYDTYSGVRPSGHLVARNLLVRNGSSEEIEATYPDSPTRLYTDFLTTPNTVQSYTINLRHPDVISSLASSLPGMMRLYIERLDCQQQD